MSFATSLVRWFDSSAGAERNPGPASTLEEHQVDWLRVLPLAACHVACLGVFWVGASSVAVGVAIALYVVRMFAITGFYHRYFSHRTFRTSRAAQLVFAVLGASAMQRGALWWAAHHRRHHRLSDRPGDVHSPVQHGFWWSHIGWYCSPHNFGTDLAQVPDLARFPELRFLDRFDVLMPFLLALGLTVAGSLLHRFAPQLGTSGPQLLVWGFFVSTVVLLHGTGTINSLSHRFGTRRFETGDESRNNPLLALITLGEGWHNNHHRHPGLTRQGLRWWEIDVTYYGLKGLESAGIVWNLHEIPEDGREEVRAA